MKRCPQCGRDYIDDTLSFCLDDGVGLLDGPASPDEPATAILPGAGTTGESPTRTFDPAEAEATKIYADRAGRPLSRKGNLLAGAIGILVITALGIGSYWFYGRESSRQIESVAVMPFVNESGNPDVEYLSDGMTETLIGSLSRIPNLSVKARSTVFFYKGKNATPDTIGKDLGVEAVLLGRVAERGDDLKLSLELVNTSNQDVIWFQQYNRKKSDLVSLQSEIARDVSSKLKSKLSGVDEEKVSKASTKNAEAYLLYLQGRHFWNKRTDTDTRKAIEQFKAAADKDPSFALAYSGLADCYVLGLGTGLNTKDRLATGKAFAEKALALDDELAEPHAALGAILEQMWKWSEVEGQYKRAIELNPNYATAYHWYSIFLRDFGRTEEALSMIKRAQELDPLSVAIYIQASIIYRSQGNFEASVENARRAIELDPKHGGAYKVLGNALLRLGRTGEAIESLKKAVALSDIRGRELGELGYAYAVQGKRSEAIAIAKELEEIYAKSGSRATSIAVVYAGLGDKEKAFEWLEKSFQDGGTRLIDIRWVFQFETLRSDPRYSDLIKRMGLPD